MSHRDVVEYVRHKHRDGSFCDQSWPLKITQYERDRLELGTRAAVGLSLAIFVGTYHERDGSLFTTGR